MNFLCLRNPKTVWKMSNPTTFASTNCISLCNAKNVPVRPTPVLECTTILEEWDFCTLWINRIKVSTFPGTLWSGQSLYSYITKLWISPFFVSEKKKKVFIFFYIELALTPPSAAGARPAALSSLRSLFNYFFFERKWDFFRWLSNFVNWKTNSDVIGVWWSL